MVWDVARNIVLNHPQRELTRREMDVFRLCGRGLLASEMTPPLSIHQITIGFHLQAARTKLGLSARSDLREFASSFYARGAAAEGLSLADADPRWVAPLAWRIELALALSGDDQTKLRLCSRCDEGWFGPSTPNVEARQLVWNSGLTEVLCAGASDATVQQWDPQSGRCLRLLEGHAGRVSCIVRHPTRDYAASASEDRTVRIWDLKKGTCLAVFEGTQHSFVGVGWTADGQRVLAGDQRGALVAWEVGGLLSEGGQASSKARDWEKQVQYSNAKVLLVGDSGVGKSGLSNYLAHGTRVSSSQQLPSTDGAWATHWPLTTKDDGGEARREIWLWDFAGQVDYRLVHQLFMDHTAAAVLVFNPQSENPFDGLGHWDRDLRKAASEPFAKLLAAGRIDRGGLVVSATTVQKFMEEHDFLAPLHETSALTGDGCEQLREAILSAVNWESIPKTTSPALYRRMKTEILSLRDSGIVLLRLAELKQRLEMQLEGERFELSELEAVVSLLAGPGMVKRLDFGGFILLRPEVLSRYAAAVVRKVRQHPQEIGCIREDEFLAGNLDFQDFQRLAPEDEAVVLRALLETFVSRAWCLRQLNEDAALLVFPSYFRRERTEQPGHPHVLVTYQFDGPTDEIYATLVVRLSHSSVFEKTELWKSAADFRTQGGASLGLALSRHPDGTARIDVYFAPDVDDTSRVVFLKCVDEHLRAHAQNVRRLRQYSCQNRKCDAFDEPLADRSRIDRLTTRSGKNKIFCSACGKPIPLRDLIEERFDSQTTAAEAQKIEAASSFAIDNESRELLAVHHAGFIVAEAGQIYRGYTNSDHGIDGEIEFKDDQGRASGKRLYLQIKSGGSYLKVRRRDGAEVFQLSNERWASYWVQQAYPVLLVIRNSDGVIRWMDVSEFLRKASNFMDPVRQLIFEGEAFDVASVRRWRNRMLAPL